MRVLVDAMTADHGGIRTYVAQLLAAWEVEHPEDDLRVLVSAGSTLPTVGHERVEVGVRRPRVLGRPWAQTRHVRRHVREWRPDAVLATLASTTLVRPGAPLAVVVHDLRHELRPEQFGPVQRLQREVSYGRGYRLADGLVAISERTRDDLAERHPTVADASVVHLGGDHALAWGVPTRDGPAIAFAHHTNKNLDLVLEGWAVLAGRGDRRPLDVVGIGASRRDEVQAQLVDLGVDDHVRLVPFLPDHEFETLVRAASMVVFPSDFEGFGLPVVEAMVLGKPVVIGPERATQEVAGGHAAVLERWDAASLADAVGAARGSTDDELASARAWASRFTWARTVDGTRTVLAGITEG